MSSRYQTRSRLWLVALFLAVFASAACADRLTTWARIQAAGRVRVGVDPSYPPFEAFDGDALRGIDIDLVEALGAQLGVTVDWVPISYDGLYDALTSSQVDLLASALVIDPQRTDDVAYSEPYFNAGQMLLGPAQAGAVTALTDLGGRSVAVELGSQGHVAATQWQRRLANVSVVPLNSAADALAAVAAGSAETALVDAISARLFIGQSNALQIIDEAVTVEPFALVVRKEDSDWLRVINRALAAMDESAELAGIMQRWFSAE